MLALLRDMESLRVTQEVLRCIVSAPCFQTPVEDQNSGTRLFLGAYAIAYFPTIFFPVRGAGENSLVTVSTNLTECFEEILSTVSEKMSFDNITEIQVERFTNLFNTFSDLYVAWHLTFTTMLTHVIPEALDSSYQRLASRPANAEEIIAQIINLRKKLEQFGGPWALHAYDERAAARARRSI